MRLQSLEIQGFKSFAKKVELSFNSSITAIVGPNGSGKSNVSEAFRFVLGEQSVKSLRGKKGEDLIFGGGKTLARQNRAQVKVVFDNKDKRLPIDFDTVAIERIVHRDGFNEYFINGSRVRLKDIIELLAHSHIGSSGHHIISQGEADRILSASTFERKEMVEDALGLKIYHYRKKESIKKLEKTNENIAQVESLRREIHPHLNFLKKQVDKLEKAKELKEKLINFSLDFFKREAIYINHTRKTLLQDKKQPEEELGKIKEEIINLENNTQNPDDSRLKKELVKLEEIQREIINKKDQISKELWKIEGELSFILKMHSNKKDKVAKDVNFIEFEAFIKDINTLLYSCDDSNDIQAIISTLRNIKEKIKNFFDKVSDKGDIEQTIDTSALENRRNDIQQQIGSIEKELLENKKSIDVLIKEIEKERENYRERDHNIYRLKARENELISIINNLKIKEERLIDIENEQKRELGEVGAMIGHIVSSYEKYEISEQEVLQEDRHKQDERKRELSKMKIRLEDAGLGTGEEVLKEYKDTTERDDFLKRELLDLQNTSESLKKLIDDLDIELEKRFNEGIVKINNHFGMFFKTMFGGGEARLDITKESMSGDEDTGEIIENSENKDNKNKIGIDVYIALPHKRTKGLVMLSGGERALTSIALLFALSQVNPPPFVILDETDAALDEANSRKYGDMLEALAKNSQLILITHNRETMSRAGMLYGVTMSAEGYSTLLSIKFEEATKNAK